jgi:hypothetical protein
MAGFTVFQHIFIVFFAVFYGLMLVGLETFGPFPFDTLRKLSIGEIDKSGIGRTVADMKRCKQRRLLLSVLLLVVLPLAYFLLVLDVLARYDAAFTEQFVRPSDVHWFVGFAALLFALSVIGFRQVYLAAAGPLRDVAFCDRAERFEGAVPRDIWLTLGSGIIVLFPPWVVIFVFELVAG